MSAVRDHRVNDPKFKPGDRVLGLTTGTIYELVKWRGSLWDAIVIKPSSEQSKKQGAPAKLREETFKLWTTDDEDGLT